MIEIDFGALIKVAKQLTKAGCGVKGRFPQGDAKGDGFVYTVQCDRRDGKPCVGQNGDGECPLMIDKDNLTKIFEENALKVNS